MNGKLVLTLALAALLVLSACATGKASGLQYNSGSNLGGQVQQHKLPRGGKVLPHPAVCGNGRAETGEECDGSDLRGQDCVSQGFDNGNLSCTSNCTYDTSGCYNYPYCGDGICNGGETYNSCPADCPPPEPYCGDGICNGNEDAASCPSDCGNGTGGNSTGNSSSY